MPRRGRRDVRRPPVRPAGQPGSRHLPRALGRTLVGDRGGLRGRLLGGLLGGGRLLGGLLGGLRARPLGRLRCLLLPRLRGDRRHHLGRLAVGSVRSLVGVGPRVRLVVVEDGQTAVAHGCATSSECSWLLWPSVADRDAASHPAPQVGQVNSPSDAAHMVASLSARTLAAVSGPPSRSALRAQTPLTWSLRAPRAASLAASCPTVRSALRAQTPLTWSLRSPRAASLAASCPRCVARSVLRLRGTG